MLAHGRRARCCPRPRRPSWNRPRMAGVRGRTSLRSSHRPCAAPRPNGEADPITDIHREAQRGEHRCMDHRGIAFGCRGAAIPASKRFLRSRRRDPHTGLFRQHEPTCSTASATGKSTGHFTSSPGHGPSRIPQPVLISSRAWELARQCGASARTLSRIIARGAMPRLWDLDPVTGTRIRSCRSRSTATNATYQGT